MTRRRSSPALANGKESYQVGDVVLHKKYPAVLLERAGKRKWEVRYPAYGPEDNKTVNEKQFYPIHIEDEIDSSYKDKFAEAWPEVKALLMAKEGGWGSKAGRHIKNLSTERINLQAIEDVKRAKEAEAQRKAANKQSSSTPAQQRAPKPSSSSPSSSTGATGSRKRAVSPTLSTTPARPKKARPGKLEASNAQISGALQVNTTTGIVRGVTNGGPRTGVIPRVNCAQPQIVVGIDGGSQAESSGGESFGSRVVKVIGDYCKEKFSELFSKSPGSQ